MLPTQYEVNTVQIICFGFRTMTNLFNLIYKIYLILETCFLCNSTNIPVQIFHTLKTVIYMKMNAAIIIFMGPWCH